MSTYDQTYADAKTIAAVFTDGDSARDALANLHDAGFHHVWLGVTRSDPGNTTEPTLQSEGAGGFMDAVGRFFSGEGSPGRALHETLVHRGLSEQQARRIDATIAPGNAVVTVDGNDDPGGARRVLRQSGGRLDDSATPSGSDVAGSDARSVDARGVGVGAGTADAGRIGETAVGAAGSDAWGTDAGYAAQRAANDTDETRRLQLREERLSVDKERLQSGEARVGKRVVSEQQSVDVPVFHEELYVERRPASGTAARETTPIGEGEEIRIPLTQERVDVNKRTVVREDVTVGKRRVEGTEHVDDTVRREELRVEDTGIDPNADSDTSDDAPLRGR
ncbi:MAG: YsnF/AvaK domain-containing protein [Candidatus Eremiobacteraeota bacterium]|nr:YsnF/AvaK domain-containing protein [Candidatus Eremiobacteraeota bacterium]